MTKPISNAVLMNELKHVKESVDDIKNKLDKDYVTKDEVAQRDIKIEMLQKIVYGIVGLILTAVVGAVVSYFVGRDVNL